MYQPQQNNPYNSGNPLRALGGKLLGYVSIALGALAIIIGLLPCINLIAILAGIIGIIVGIVALRQSSKGRTTNNYAWGGIALSVLGIIISLAINNFVLDKIGDEDEDRPAVESNEADY